MTSGRQRGHRRGDGLRALDLPDGPQAVRGLPGRAARRLAGWRGSLHGAGGQVVGGAGGGGVALGHRGGEPLADRGLHGLDRDQAAQRGEGAEQGRVRHRPAEVLPGQLGGRHGDRSGRVQLAGELADTERPGLACGVDQHQRAAASAVEHADLVQQGRVPDDQGVRVGHRLPGADRPVVDPAERDHRRAGPLRAEAREGLRVPPLGEGRGGQQLGCGHHALAATAVDAYLEHRTTSAGRAGRCAAGRHPSGPSYAQVRRRPAAAPSLRR